MNNLHSIDSVKEQAYNACIFAIFYNKKISVTTSHVSVYSSVRVYVCVYLMNHCFYSKEEVGNKF
jgi:hypothetical protein